MIEELRALGLTGGEIKVYSALLGLGEAPVNKIHEKVQLDRRAIYDRLNKLIERGLVTFTTEKGTKKFQCAPPSKLKEKLDNKRKELDAFDKKLKDINKIYTSAKPSIRSETFRGKEGIKSVFEDMLNYKEVLFIGGRWYAATQMPIYWHHYNKRRIKNKVIWKNLVLHDAPKTPTKQYVDIKVLPKEFSGAPTITIIYGNKVVNVMWGEELFAFSIESEEIANNNKIYHQYLWGKIAKTP